MVAGFRTILVTLVICKEKTGVQSMTKMFKLLNEVRRDEEGLALAEYAILLGLIAVVCIGVVTTVGTDIKAVFTTIGADLAAVS
jgi:pilus assembly protein Flp/PilA